MYDILIVDDDIALLDALECYFVSREYRVMRVASGEAALDYLSHSHPDCLVLDYDLPGMDGFAVCQSVREHSSIPHHLPLVLYRGRKPHPRPGGGR